jgi:PAS domain S-box-containing protein
MLHAAFGCMFVFLYRQHRARFSRLMAQSWLLEAFRAYINLTQLSDTGGWVNHWHSLSDCLGIFATWWLLSGCADMVGVRLPIRLGRYYIGLSLPLILILRYLVPLGLAGWLNAPLDRVGFVSVFVELIVIFVPVTIARVAILWWFIRLWRRTRLPGALLAIIFGVPYVVFALLVPIQFYLTYYPDWIYQLWAARVLGFSLGLVMLLFDKQLLAQREGEVVMRDSEMKFHAVFAQSPLAIMLTTLPEDRLVDANQAAETLLGYRLAELRGKTTGELKIWANPDDRDHYLRILQSTSGMSGFEARMCVRDGRELAVLFHGRVVHVDGHMYVLNSLLDITERKRMETDLQARTAFFQAQVDSALDGILVVDSAGRKILQNQRMAEVWKIPPEVANDKDDAQQVRFVTGRTKNPQQFVEKVIYLYSHPTEISRDIIELVDGTILDRYSAPVSDKAGNYYGRIWTFRDITESRKAEELVRHLATFPELNPNPVLEFDQDGTLGYHSPAALAMARKVGAASLTEMLPPAASSIVRECLARGVPRLRQETTHGRNKLSWSYYPIASQQVVHCYVDDITDLQSLEEQLRQAQKMEAIGQLSGGIAHDFNNLLTAIIGHLGLLRGNPRVTPEIEESLVEISTAANRAANLTSQLLAFSRRQVLSTSALDLNEVVTNLAKMLRRVLGEQVNVQLDFAPEELTFQGDGGMMEQVLVNLAVNARDAMPQGGTLRITTRRESRLPPAREGVMASAGEFVRLSVSDTGTGILPEFRDKIFEPFFTTKGVGKGTGLGLATVFGIMQQHHGWIEVESEVGQGATFHLYLPLLARPSPISLVSESSPSSRAPRGRGELILLVEDEAAVQQIVMQALGRYGYRVLLAANGPEALKIWAERKAEIALLLTDLIMPEGISGLQLARRLVEDKPMLRVVYTSGYSADIAGKELKLTDGVNYVAKPYELDRLFQTVRAALDRKQSHSPF